METVGGDKNKCYNRAPITNEFDDFLFCNDDDSFTTIHPRSPPIDSLG